MLARNLLILELAVLGLIRAPHGFVVKGVDRHGDVRRPCISPACHVPGDVLFAVVPGCE